MSKSLAQQFADAQERLAAAQVEHDHVRSAYFLDRRQRAARGEELEPLVCLDANAWNEQLARESTYRENSAKDRAAGLVA